MMYKCRINRWLVLCFILSSLSARFCEGKSYIDIPGELANQLLNLKKGYRYRFAQKCFLGTCDQADMVDVDKYYWKSDILREHGRDKFWNTYKCTISGDNSACPVDGGWSRWTEWGPCSVTCGDGARTRNRACNTPVPRNGGTHCVGQDTEVTDCEMQKCMSVVGVAPHHEATIKMAAESVDKFHSADPALVKDCWIGHCTYTHVFEAITPKRLADSYWTHLNCFKYSTGCPLDGGWSEWGLWSACSSGCGEGRANRRRHCDNPTPRNGGALCEGPMLEETVCFDNRCRNTVGPLLTPWSQWSGCSRECDLGVTVSTRTCTNKIVGCQDGLGKGVKEMEKSAPCYNKPCQDDGGRADGGWTGWSEWSPCSATCGSAAKERYRLCAQPLPSHGGDECEGDSQEQQACDLRPCPASLENWSVWTPWTGCSSDCNGGIESRERTCATKDLHAGMINGCVGEFIQTTTCNLNQCSANGLWANWASWSGCSRTCNQGVQYRDRTCTDPAPTGNGTQCDGIGTELRQCYEQPCPESSDESRVFHGASYLFYPATATPSRLLFMYLRFKSVTLDGLLVVRRGPGKGMPLLTVGLANSYVELHLVIGSNTVHLMASQIMESEWNSLELSIASNKVSMRLNDGKPISKMISIGNPAGLNFDQEMYIGGAPAGKFPKVAKQEEGFYGTVSDVRVNYKEYSLKSNEDWQGPGTPMIAHNVGQQQTDIHAVLPYFDGDEYSMISLPYTKPNPSVLHITIVLRMDHPDGIILHNIGKIPGSFVVVNLRRRNLQTIIRDGTTIHTIYAGEIQLRKWYIISLVFEGQEGEIRLNHGPATQINTMGKPYIPSREVHIGGVSQPDKSVTEILTHSGIGMTGTVYKVVFNGVEFMMKDCALRNSNQMFNSAAATLAAHYEEKYVIRHSSVKLRCDYGAFLAEQPANVTVTWLKESQILEISDNIKVVEQEPLEPYTSTLHLHWVEESRHGMYSCLVHHNGVDVITHAFGIVLHEFNHEWLKGSALGSFVLLCIFMFIAFGTAFVIVVSCVKCLRHRVRCLEILYNSLGNFFHFGNYEVKEPNAETIHQVDMTYTEDFSPSEAVKIEREKAARKGKDKKRGSAETTKGKHHRRSILKKPKFLSKKKKLSFDESQGSSSAKGQPGDSDKPVAIEISPSASVVTRNVLPQPASTLTSDVSSDRKDEVVVVLDVDRKPSESLSTEEIVERRLSHTLLTGNSSSSSTDDDDDDDEDEKTSEPKKAKEPARPTVDTSHMFGRRRSSSGAANMLAAAIIRSQHADLDNIDEDY